VGLGVEVDQPDFLSGFGKGSAKVNGGRRFSDSAFLVDDGDGTHVELLFPLLPDECRAALYERGSGISYTVLKREKW